jgi:hypothetical protein
MSQSQGKKTGRRTGEKKFESKQAYRIFSLSVNEKTQKQVCKGHFRCQPKEAKIKSELHMKFP